MTATLHFPRLAAYASFLHTRHLAEYASAYGRIFSGLQLDQLPFLAADYPVGDEALFRKQAGLHLRLLAEDRAAEQIALKMQRLLPTVTDTSGDIQLKSATVFRLSYVIKQAFRELLPLYTDDAAAMLAVIAELDQYTLFLEEAANRTSLDNLEQLLNLREEQLLEAQQLSGTGSYVWRLAERRGETTPELLHMLHIGSSAEIAGHLERIYPEDREKVRQVLGEAIQHLSPFDLRYRFSSEAGERIILTRGKVVSGPEGIVIKGTVMDITDTEQLVQRLEESRKLYREAQELARMGNWRWDTATDQITWSDEVYHICELDPQEQPLSTALLRRFVHPADWAEVRRQILQLKSTGKPIFYIGSIWLKDGREKILEIKGRFVCDASGRLLHIIGTIQDVTHEQTLIRRLQDTERRYRHMESIAGIGNWIIDFDRNESQVTDEFCRIYGIPPDVGHDLAFIRSFVHKDDRVMLDRMISRCREEGIPYTCECRITTADGLPKMLLVRGEAVRDNAGRIWRIAGTAQDITKEHDLLTQLQRSEVLYKQAQSIGRMGNWVYDTGTGVMEWSDELYHIFDVERDDPAAQEKAGKKIMSPDAELLQAHFTRCREHGISYDCHCRVQAESGQIRHFRSKGEVAPAIAGKPRQMIGTVQDVTEQVMVEKQLRDNQKFTQKIADIAPSVIAVYDIHTGRYAFISMAIEHLLGYSRHELMEGGVAFVTGIIHPDDLTDMTAQHTAALERANARYEKDMPEEVSEFKYRMRHKDGSYRWFRTFGTVFDRDEQNKVQQVLNISMDISNEKQAELALNHKNMLLEQSNSSLEEFAYIASHDLQEPLRKISTFGNMLQTLQDEHLTPSGQLYLRKIVDSALRMQQMISDLLSVSIISGNRSFSLESLQGLLDEVLVTLEYKIEETGARIDVPAALPEARVVAPQFRQLFQNLISNSLKFARASVKPVIRICYDYLTGDAAYQLNLDQDRQYLRLIFEDNGIGFSNNYAGKIFAIFQRLHGKSEYEGTGIGLAVCKKIVEHHNGVIFASGEPDKGAVFTIILPA